VGQYFNYRKALEKLEPERVLYLAIPTDVYQTFFTDPFVQDIIDSVPMKLLVFLSDEQEIALWKE